VLARDKQCAQHHSRIQAFKHARTSLTARIDYTLKYDDTSATPLDARGRDSD
jgi:hypothetical protein